MRMLNLHSDFIEYEPISKEINDAEENISGSKVRFEDLVVTFIAVERGDDESIAKAAVDEIKKYLDTVKSKRLLIYPYAHLSSDLASVKDAYELLKLTERMAVKDLKVFVSMAPFGWTKAFNIKVKGHPLAESAIVLTKQKIPSGVVSHETADKNNTRTNNVADVEHAEEQLLSSALKAEEKQHSSWYILSPGGELSPMETYEFKKQEQNLHILASYEMAK
jgi:threonyl-tRNA synthetase